MNLDTPAVCIDFETYYDKEYSVANMSYYHYVNHEKFDPYLVAIATNNFCIYSDPVTFPWEQIDGHIWVAHNVTFDKFVFERIAEIHNIKARPLCWMNTADLAVYIQGPRSLAGATKQFMDHTMDKTVRSDMCGVQYHELNDEKKRGLQKYAMDDARLALKFWKKFQEKWPEHERELSQHTTLITERGVGIDTDKLHRWIKNLGKRVWELESEIPWSGETELTPTGRVRMKGGEPRLKPLTSPGELAKAARDAGVPMPESTDVKSPEFQAWEAEHGESFPLIKIIQELRKVNRLFRLSQAIEQRLRPDGRMEHELLYFGAHTGRWAGKRGYTSDDETPKGVNMLNLIKAPYTFQGEEMSFRSLFTPAKGKKYIIADLAQIEPRCMAHMAGDFKMLDLMREGMSPYEAHARITMGWTGGVLKSENPTMYAFAKARVLALGYGAGWEKFIYMAPMYIPQSDFDLIFTADVKEEEEKKFKSALRYGRGNDEKAKAFDSFDRKKKNIWVNSWLQVKKFRATNLHIIKLWADREKQMKLADDSDMIVKLMSKRTYKYFDVSAGFQKGIVSLPSRQERLYGGKLVENECQANAREVFADRLLALEKAGHPVIWHVYDEYIIEVDKSVSAVEIRNIIMTSPEWATDMPLDVDIIETDHYCK